MSAGHGSEGSGKGMAVFGGVILVVGATIAFMAAPSEWKVLLAGILVGGLVFLGGTYYAFAGITFCPPNHSLVVQGFNREVLPVNKGGLVKSGTRYVWAHRKPHLIDERKKFLDVPVKIVTSGHAADVFEAMSGTEGLKDFLSLMPEGLELLIGGFVEYQNDASVTDAKGCPTILSVDRSQSAQAVLQYGQAALVDVTAGLSAAEIWTSPKELKLAWRCAMELDASPEMDDRPNGFLKTYGIDRPTQRERLEFFYAYKAEIEEWIEQVEETARSPIERRRMIRVLSADIRKVTLPKEITELNKRRVIAMVYPALVETYMIKYGMEQNEADSMAALILGLDIQVEASRFSGLGSNATRDIQRGAGEGIGEKTTEHGGGKRKK